MKNEIVRMLEESVLLQGTMALVLLSTIVYLVIAQKEVPAELLNFMSLILGFYFGSKVENKRATIQSKRRKE